MKPVSRTTEQPLRAALARLAAGNAMQTDGRLTVANLAREAGVSRATANRAPFILSNLQDMVKARKQEEAVGARSAAGRFDTRN